MGAVMVTWFSGLAPVPTDNERLKSGNAAIVKLSPALPRLIVNELVGRPKSVCSKLTGLELNRLTLLPLVPSSPRVALVAVAGRLNTRLAAVEPVVSIGARPV